MRTARLRPMLRPLAALTFAIAVLPQLQGAVINLPAPVYFEDFDSTPESALPAGWTGGHFTEVVNTSKDLANLDSAAYAGWTTVNASRFNGPLVQYSDPAQSGPVYQRVLSSNPANIVNGQVITNLAHGRMVFANSGYRRGRSQVQFLFSPDYDLSARTNVHLSFHSIFEQNQDSFAAVEYSTNAGASWLPIVYMLDATDIASSSGSVDAAATLRTVYSDVATYLEPGSGQVRGGFYGAFIGVESNRWASLAPFLSGRINDDPVESKRVELFRLPAADHQPRVRFRFAHAGTDSWYFGIDDFGIYSINAGSLPVVLSTPTVLRLSQGTTATFRVTATGPEPLRYQWFRDADLLPGATNAVLQVPEVSAASPGTYTVRVGNDAGTITATAGTLTVYTPRITGQWDFNTPNLRATIGSDLEFLGDTEWVTTFPQSNIGAGLAGVMGFETQSVTQGYLMRHGARPNGGGRFVNQYTLLLDLRFPQESHNQWRALFQTDPFNHAGNDADLYVANGLAAPAPNGIGIEGQFDGPISPEAWHRIAFSVDLNAPPPGQLTKYLDGTRVGSQSIADGLDGHLALGPTALLFTTGVRPGDNSWPGLVNSIQFIDGWMDGASITRLGGPTASGFPTGGAELRITNMHVEGANLGFGIAGGAGPFQLQRSDRPAVPEWEDVGPPTTNRSLTLTNTSAATAFYRIRQLDVPVRVGPQPEGESVLPTAQWLRPAGETVKFGGRPIDLVLSPDRATLYAKDNRGILSVDTSTWTLRQQLAFPDGGGSMHGIAVSADGARVFATTASSQLCEATRDAQGTLAWSRRITLPDAAVGGAAFPCGVALSPDSSRAYVCLSRNNTLAVVNLEAGTVLRQIPTGIAPFDVVLSSSGSTAYVSDWGGRRPVATDRKAKSAGTDVLVDARGVAASGTVTFIDLTRNVVTATVPVGLHPSGLTLSPDGATLYCANANSDTVSIIDTATAVLRETVNVRPDAFLPYGSAANDVTTTPDGQRLLVANGGNNAVAVVGLPRPGRTTSTVEGFLPTDWYPSAVATDGTNVFIANTKGLGSRNDGPTATAHSVYSFLGTITKLPIPNAESLPKLTSQVHEDGRVPQMLRAWQQARSGQTPQPVPTRTGEPSVFEHVIYVIKENRTYDQIFGDLPQGNGDTNLCIFGRTVTPNHHALAEQFVLLDNFYCNGVNSSDGHAWATEGNVGDYLERSFGGAARGYTWGDDPLSYSSTGFIWDNVLLHGLSFRNYGEMDYAETVPAGLSWLTVYRDFVRGTNAVSFSQNIGIEPLRPYSVRQFPGWNMRIPDVIRADRFIRDLQAAEATGLWPNFTILYLPNDHTSGTSPGAPTPRAQVADNDLALGRCVEALSHSRFWPKTVVFVIEDDPQDGFDHVDGHRSIGLVISPYTKRRAVVSDFYNQTAVIHTMERILGLPPMNQMDALAPVMSTCFTPVPDFTPFLALKNNIALDEMNPGTVGLKGKELHWARQSMAQNFAQFDRANEDTLNRILWHSVKGVDAKYPVQFAGAHGKGLKKLSLRLEPSAAGDDDD